MTLDIVFAIMWIIIALYLFFLAFTEDTFYFFIAPFFVFLGLWAFIDSQIKTNLMAGPFLWIYRGVATLMLIIWAIKYFYDKKHR